MGWTTARSGGLLELFFGYSAFHCYQVGGGNDIRDLGVLVVCR
jgi:hypothetical protein